MGLGFGMMDIFFNVMSFLFPFLFIGTFVFIIMSWVSPKFRGKMMSREIKAQKYMMEESKEDLRDIATTSAEATSEGIKITAKAIKEGFSEEMIFCKYCGKEIDADSRFCKHCGEDLS
ncbi:MAG: zinc ribbon domain-containing protein [Anaerofustis stercorihominis]|nr:zinc ribbon domain-containing protein [Anaerofustis stercorihominis]